MPMTFWTPRQVAASIGGDWLRPPTDPDAPLAGLTIDSRAVRPGQVFLAVRGANFDGHDFVTAARDAGAAMAVVAREPDASALDAAASGAAGGSGFAVLRVADTVVALQALARVYRGVLRQAGVKVVAVTGSNGKTTTRHLIHALLSTRLRGTQSPRSFNNHLGLPLTLLGAGVDDDFVVAEIGMNRPGEIAALSEIARPDVGVITHLGVAHIEAFGSREAIAVEKLSLLRYVEPGGLAVIPPRVPEGVSVPVPAGVRLRRRGEHASLTARLSLPGEHNRVNAWMAIEVARWFGAADEAIVEALAEVTPLSGRLERRELGGGAVLIHDAYNANPDSMPEALRRWAVERGRRHVIVFADMLELGEIGPEEHRRAAERMDEAMRAADAPADADTDADTGEASPLAVLIGPLASRHTAEALRERWGDERVHAFETWSDDLPSRVAALLADGDVILLKGSRGMALERLIPAIEARFAPAAAAPAAGACPGG